MHDCRSLQSARFGSSGAGAGGVRRHLDLGLRLDGWAAAGALCGGRESRTVEATIAAVMADSLSHRCSRPSAAEVNHSYRGG